MTTPPHFSKKTPVLLQSPDFNFLPVIAKNNIYQQPHAHNMCYKITQQTFFANHKLLFIYKKLRKKTDRVSAYMRKIIKNNLMKS